MKLAALVLSLAAVPAAAQDLIVQFADAGSQPTISFHADGCNIANAILMLDLAGSQGGYSFDGSKSAGASPPVAIAHGYAALSPVRNGDKRLQLLVHSLVAGDTLDLHAGLSDAAGSGAAGAGLAGASVRLALRDRVVSGVFDAAGKATIALPTGTSFCVAAAE